MLLKKLTTKNIYPTINPLNSTSTILQPQIINKKHYKTTQKIKQTLQHYKKLQNIITILNLNKLSKKNHLTITKTQKIKHFLSQPFFITKIFPNKPIKTSTTKKNYNKKHSIFHTLTTIKQSSSNNSSKPKITIIS